MDNMFGTQVTGYCE